MKRNHTAPTKRTQFIMHMHILFMNPGASKKKKLRLDQFAQMCTPVLVFAIGTWLKSFSTRCESFVFWLGEKILPSNFGL